VLSSSGGKGDQPDQRRLAKLAVSESLTPELTDMNLTWVIPSEKHKFIYGNEN